MGTVAPLYRNIHVLFVENDWVIREILLEHFAMDGSCRAISFPDAERAFSHLRLTCGAERIFSNISVGGRGGIDLSAGAGWQSRIELAIAPGYDAEGDRFGAIKAGLGFFRVKPYAAIDLWQVLRHTLARSLNL